MKIHNVKFLLFLVSAMFALQVSGYKTIMASNGGFVLHQSFALMTVVIYWVSHGEASAWGTAFETG